jgi:hypothetical protein
MIENETLIILSLIGIVALILTVIIFFTGKKVDNKNKQEKDIGNVKIFSTNLKLVPILYLIIITIMFVIGLFSNFLFNSILGFIIASVPFLAYFIFDFRRD